MLTYMHAYVHTYIHTYTHRYVRIYATHKIHKNMCTNKHCTYIIHTYIHTYIRTHMYVHTCTHARTHARARARPLRSNMRAKFVHIRLPSTCFSWQEIVSTTFCSFRLCADMMSQYKSLLRFVRKQWGRLIVDCNLQSALLGSRFVRTTTLLPCHLT